MKWKFTLDHDTLGTLVLPDEPIGWADIVQNFKRDPKWHGVFFDFSIPLKYWGEGYEYIKAVYETYGIDDYVELLVEIQCSETDSFEEFYTGKLVMAKYKEIIEDQCYVEVPLEQAGCLMSFRNRIDQKVNLDDPNTFEGTALTAYDGLDQYIDLLPKTIVQRTECELIDNTGTSPGIENHYTVAGGTGTDFMQEFMYINIKANTVTVNEVQTFIQPNFEFSLSVATMQPVLVADGPGEYTFDFNMEECWIAADVFFSGIDVDGCGAADVLNDYQVWIEIAKNNVLQTNSTLINLTSDCLNNGEIGGLVDASISHTMTLAAGDEVKIYFRIRCAATYNRVLSAEDVTIEHEVEYRADGYFNIRYESENPATPCRNYFVNEALSRIVEAYTDDCMRVYSDYFGRTDAEPYTSDADGCGSLEVLFKGLHARQFPANRVLMALSFNELFDALNSIHCIGIGVEPDDARPANQVIRVEPFEYWYDGSASILDCDNVPLIERSALPEKYVGSFLFGYEKWEAENSMGLDEYCTKREYRSTRKEIKNTVDAKCKFIASGYAIEVTRTKPYTSESTTDWRWDNDTFILCVRRDGGGIAVEQGQDCADTSTMTDVIDPDTVYNYRISPIRNLMRWGKLLFGTYTPNHTAANAEWMFNDGVGNFIVKGKLINGCVLEAAEVAENDTIDYTTFDDSDDAYPILRPEQVKFDYPVTWETIKAWRDDPSLLRKTIRYRHRSTDAWSEGFVLDIQYKPNDGICSFTLMSKY